MCQVVAYNRLKTIKSYDVDTSKSGRVRWSFTRGFKYRALTGKHLVYWIGGRSREVVAWRFDCLRHVYGDNDDI